MDGKHRYQGWTGAPVAVYRPANVHGIPLGIGAFELGIGHVDTISPTEAADFIPEIWAQSAIEILRSNIIATPRILRDTDVASFTVGDKLNIPYPGTLSASAKAFGTAYTLAQPSNADTITVELSNHQAVSVVIEDISRAQANQDLMARYANAAAIALAEKIETDVITELQTATNNVGTYGTDLSAAGLQAVWKAMTDNKAPEDGRTLIVSTKDAIALLGDTDLTNYFAFARSQAVSAGPQALGPVYGLDTFASQFITTDTGPNPDETKCVAFRRDGAIIAFRGLPDPPSGSGAVAANVADPQSGVVIRVVMAYRADLGGVQVTYEVLYGVSKLQEAKLLLVKS